MSDKQIQEIYKLVDLLEMAVKFDLNSETFNTIIELNNQKYHFELEEKECLKVISKVVSNKLIEIVNMEEE